jgi:hypothetical protein
MWFADFRGRSGPVGGATIFLRQVKLFCLARPIVGIKNSRCHRHRNRHQFHPGYGMMNFDRSQGSLAAAREGIPTNPGERTLAAAARIVIRTQIRSI